MEPQTSITEWQRTEARAKWAFDQQNYAAAVQYYDKFLCDVRELGPLDINVLWAKRHKSEALVKLGLYKQANEIQKGILDLLSPPASGRSGDVLPGDQELIEDVLHIRIDLANALRYPPNVEHYKMATEVLRDAAKKSSLWLGSRHELTQTLAKYHREVLFELDRVSRKAKRRQEREKASASVTAEGGSLSEPTTMPASHLPAADTDHAGDQTSRNMTLPMKSTSVTRFDFSDAQVLSGVPETETRSEGWFSDLEKETHGLMDSWDPLTSRPGGRVRIAILDTGLNHCHPDVRSLLSRKGTMKRIQGMKSWVTDPQDPTKLLPPDEDEAGHGTHCAMVAHRVAPNADLFIARIFRNATTTGKNWVQEAIKHAVEEWQVDIISMSFSIKQNDEIAIRSANEALSQYHSKVLFFAAASNQGLNNVRSFPASHDDVLAIHCANGWGKWHEGNPAPWKSKHDPANLCTLGVDVKAPSCGQEYRVYTGSSVATAIVAGIAALVLEFSRQETVDGKLPLENVAYKLLTKKGLVSVFGAMKHHKEADEGYTYLAPWRLLSTKPYAGDSQVAITEIARKIKEALSE